MYDCRRLRGWNRFAGGSLVTIAANLVRLQAKREVGDYVLASFNKFIRCIIFTGCAGGRVLLMLSKNVYVDFGSPPSETGGW